MGFIQTFCFCCNVRIGSMICAAYSLVAAIVYMTLVFVRYTDLEAGSVHNGIMYSTLAVFGIQALASIVLLAGVQTDTRTFFVPYLVETVVCIVHGTVSNVWIIRVHLDKDMGIGPCELAILAVHIVNSVTSVYCVLCVASQLHDLVNGKGTQDYYRRMSERQRRVMEFILSMQRLQEGDLPFQGPPPPLEGVDNVVFNSEVPIPPPPPTSPNNQDTSLPPPPYSSLDLDKPPDYSTLPREGCSRPGLQCDGQASNSGRAQGILGRRHARQMMERSQRTNGRFAETGQGQVCPEYRAAALGRSWDQNTDAQTGRRGGAGRSMGPDHPDGHPDFSSASTSRSVPMQLSVDVLY